MKKLLSAVSAIALITLNSVTVYADGNENETEMTGDFVPVDLGGTSSQPPVAATSIDPAVKPQYYVNSNSGNNNNNIYYDTQPGVVPSTQQDLPTLSLPAEHNTSGEPQYYQYDNTIANNTGDNIDSYNNTGTAEQIMPEVIQVPASENLNASAQVDIKGTVTISWNKIDGVNNYTVYRVKNGKYTKLGTTAENSYSVKGVKNVSENVFLVNGGGRSCEITVNVYYKPAVTVKTGDNSVRLSWKAVPGAEKYAVYKKVNGKLKKVTEIEKTAAKLKTRSGGTFAVRAYIGGEWTSVTKSDLVTIKQ